MPNGYALNILSGLPFMGVIFMSVYLRFENDPSEIWFSTLFHYLKEKRTEEEDASS